MLRQASNGFLAVRMSEQVWIVGLENDFVWISNLSSP